MKQFFQGRGFQVAVLMLAAFLVLIVNREFGVADNGDFGRYMGEFVSIPAHLKEMYPMPSSEEWQPRYFLEPQFYWKPALADFSPPWFSSALLFWKVGAGLSKHLFSAGVVNLKYIGLPLFLLHFLALAFLVRRVSPASLPKALMLLGSFLILTDARITAFYNSFYAESVPFLALFLVFAFLAGRIWSDRPLDRATGKETGLFCIVLLMLAAAVFAKRQYLYFLGPVLIFAYYCVKAELRLPRARGAVLLGGFALAILTIAGSLTISQRLSNSQELSAASYTSANALYYGLLPHSKKQAQLLEELRLPATSASLIGRSSLDPRIGPHLTEVVHSLTIKTFLKAIVLDPRAFLGSLWQNAKEVGNFGIPLGMVHGDLTAAYPPKLVSVFSHGSTKIAGGGLFALAVLLAVILTLFPVGVSAERRFASRILSFTLLTIIVSDVVISTFDGQQEVRKHVMVASLAVALMLVHAVSSLVAHWRRKRRHGMTVA